MNIKNGRLIGFIISLIFIEVSFGVWPGYSQVTNGYFDQGNTGVISIRATDGSRIHAAIKERVYGTASGEALAVPEKADTLVLYPTDDAFISVWNQNENYGNLSYLDVLGKGGRSRGRYFCCTPAFEFVSYLRFSVPDVQGEIVSARLHLFCEQGNHLGGIFFLNPIESALDWSERTITWNNRPNLLNDPQTFLVYQDDVPVNRWSSFDVTNVFLNEWKTYTFVLAMQENNATQWSSKEGNHPPYLEIVCVKNALPYIDNVRHNDLSPGSVVFNWQTNVLTRFQFDYGEKIGILGQRANSNQFHVNHVLQIDGLTPGTRYYYSITVFDALGHLFKTPVDSFTTQQYDHVPPKIEIFSPHSPMATNHTPIEIHGKVYDNDILGVDINGVFYQLNKDSTFNGNVNLKEGVNEIVISGTDFSGNIARDTLYVTLDTTAPILAQHSVSALYAANATISWSTNELSIGSISYGQNSGKEDTVRTDSVYSVVHHLNISGLSPQSNYKYYIYTYDSLGNSSEWGPYGFVTKKANLIKISASFAYFGDVSKQIDHILVDLYADGKKVSVDTAQNGTLTDLKVVFENNCKLDWAKIDTVSSISAIHMYDAALVALYSVGRNQLDSLQKIAADVDLNGSVSMYDAVQIARFSVGLSLPASSRVGAWRFFPDSLVIAQPDVAQYQLSVIGIILGDVHKDWRQESHVAKIANISNELWFQKHVTFQGDTIAIDVALNCNDNTDHFSFFVDAEFDGGDAKFLDYSLCGDSRINIFRNVGGSSSRIGGFSTNPINNNRIQLKFLNLHHGELIKVKYLYFLLDDQEIIKTNNAIIKQDFGNEPKVFRLFQNYPNPFNSTTEIRFVTPKMGKVSLAVFNQNGDLVRLLLKGNMPSGMHRIFWDGIDNQGKQTSSGLYFVQLRYRKQKKVLKLLYLK